MKSFVFVEPESLQAVSAALAHPGAKLIAGGSDLLAEMKEGTENPETLVSLARLEALKRIEPFQGGLRIGALVTISELELSRDLAGPYAMLSEAARGVATPELRNQGTLGGNLAQRPRCLHFRNPLTPCLKKGGATCPAADSPYQNYLAIMGGAGCYAVNPSDLAPPLIALDAQVEIEGLSGSRNLPLESFFIGPERSVKRETVLGPGEVVTHILLPALAPGWRGQYSKTRERTAGDFAIVSGAVGYELVDGRMRDVRVVLGGVAPAPMRFAAAEAEMEGQAPIEATAKRAADAALAGAEPLAHNAYKLDLAHALIWRSVMRLAA